MNDTFWAPAAGALALVVIWLLLWALRGGRWTLKGLIDGEDRRPSTSRFQFFVWTVVVIYAYVSISAARVLRGQPELIGDVPANLLVAMGLSIGTAVGAKAIAVFGAARRPQSGPGADDPRAYGPLADTGLSLLVTDDIGNPELAKTQVLAWTFVAVGAHPVTVRAQIGRPAHFRTSTAR